MVEIVWKEPPPAVGSAETAEILAALKANPGKWAQVKKGMKSSTGYTTWKKLGCEAVARRDDAGTLWDVYARWPAKTPPTVPTYPAGARGPATPAPARPKAAATAPAHTPDPGLNKYLENRRARGNHPDGSIQEAV